MIKPFKCKNCKETVNPPNAPSVLFSPSVKGKFQATFERNCPHCHAVYFTKIYGTIENTCKPQDESVILNLEY